MVYLGHCSSRLTPTNLSTSFDDQCACTSVRCCEVCSKVAVKLRQTGIPQWEGLDYISLKELQVQCQLCKLELESASFSSTSLGSSSFLLTPPPSPLSIAYILHTTGTTGGPKPVQAPHCCIVPNIIDLCHRLGLNSDDRVFNAAAVTFDPSLVEVECFYLQLCV